MASSPGNQYQPSSNTNVISPMNVNMINQQRTGPPSNSSPNPTLNTPVMAANANASPQMRQPSNDDQLYRDKLRQLSKYIEPLKKIIIKNDSDKYVDYEKLIKHFKSYLLLFKKCQFKRNTKNQTAIRYNFRSDEACSNGFAN